MKVNRRKKLKVVYKNGGKTGDPKKDLYQDSSGFSLYRETLPDGTKIITPTPSSSNYVKLSDKVAKGYYPDIPLLLAAAEVVADDPNKDPLGAVDEVVEKTGAGVLGDYARIPESERKAVEQGVRDALNKFAKTALATTVGPVSDLYGAPQRYLVNPILSGLTGKKANYNPLGFTKSMLQEAGYADDAGEGFLTPSEALGIENPIGAFAVDAATDPSTILGLGSLARRGLKGVASSVKPTPKKVPLTKNTEIPKSINYKSGTITRQGDDMVPLGESGGMVTYVDDAGDVTYLAFPDVSLSEKGLGSRNISYKPIPDRPNTFEIKADLQSGDLGSIIDDLASALPANHIITETGNISTNGLKFWKSQIKKGGYSPTGKTQKVRVSNADGLLEESSTSGFKEATFDSEEKASIALEKIMEQIKDIPRASAKIKGKPPVFRLKDGEPKKVQEFIIDVELPELKRSFAKGGKVKVIKRRKMRVLNK